MSGGAKALVSTVVNRTQEDVFAYVVDVTKHAEWSTKAYRVEGIDAPVQLGSTRGEDFVNTNVLTREGNATRIDFTLDFPKPDVFGGFAFPLVLGGFIKPATNKGMKMLKSNTEAVTQLIDPSAPV